MLATIVKNLLRFKYIYVKIQTDKKGKRFGSFIAAIFRLRLLSVYFSILQGKNEAHVMVKWRNNGVF